MTTFIAPISSDPRRRAAAGAGPRLLVVEDDALIAQDLIDTIQELGGVVVGQAGDLEDALHCAESQEADGAFVDLNLGDGFTGCAVAEAFSERHGLPVVFITGSAEQVPNGFRHALALIEKPIQAGKVKMALTLVERLRSGARTSAQP